ncbi:MAG: hypothetical protein NT165_00700 [Candidatus Falkowbacteria bacterium]|nr:hypothetical protein [Candidatus Falkowbacteria bacterium]
MNATVSQVILAIMLAVLIINYFSKSNRIMRRLKKSSHFPKFSNFEKDKGEISVTWFVGHRKSPELVHVYKFNTKSDIARYYINTDNGEEAHFQGSLQEGLNLFAPLS